MATVRSRTDNPSASGARPAEPRRWRGPLLAILGWALLAYPIVRAQLAEVGYANRVPAAALLFDAGHARSLASLAAATQVKGQQQQAMALARDALAREPMNIAAARTTGLALEQTGRGADADRIMMLAGMLGWRDVALQVWLIKAYALKEDLRGALHRANALARLDKLPQLIYPIFMGSITDDRLRLALAQEMADRPPWRGNFFYGILQLPPEQMPNVTKLVADLARIGSPINPAERAIYLSRLVQVGQGPAALAYWRRDQRVASATVPWDGGFERVPPRGALAAPFEWQLTPESTGVAAIVPGARGGQLSVSQGRDYTGALATQTVVLRSGRYRVTAAIGGDAAATGLRWTIRCLPDQRELAIDAGDDGSELASAGFQVPANCSAQSLTIDMASGGGGAGGDITVDDVVIRSIG